MNTWIKSGTVGRRIYTRNDGLAEVRHENFIWVALVRDSIESPWRSLGNYRTRQVAEWVTQR